MKMINNRALIFLVLCSLSLLIGSTAATEGESLPMEIPKQSKEKNILVFTFPGAKSHIFIFRELFKHSIVRSVEEDKNVRYHYHIVVHNSDKNLWKGTGHSIYGFGDVESYDESFAKAMQRSKEDPVMGFDNFNKAMMHLNNDFVKDGVLEKLRGIKFDLMLTDIPNYPQIIMRKELDIKDLFFVNPTCVHIMFNSAMEYNSAYMPVIGSSSSETMTFTERFVNHFLHHATRIMYDYFNSVQSKKLQADGFNYDLKIMPRDGFYMHQCVPGVNYATAYPPNMVNMGAVLPKASHPLTDEKIIKFLNKYPRNIYVSQGTITKALRLEIIRDVFRHFPNIGFVFSLKSELHSELGELNLPENVLLLTWVPQNDLLGDERIHAFITHGGINSMLETLYHAKPMIVIGTTLDQVNNAGLVDYRKYGIAVTRESDLSFELLVESINKILHDPIYKENCKKAAKYIKDTNGKETFYYWLNYVLENGYDHLLTPAILNLNFFQLHSFDIWIIWILVIYLIYKLFQKLLVFLLSLCFIRKKEKTA